ncbi:CBS domain-containing protein, partial [Enterococcus lactis]|uniref:CBS domain-containing protein n=1 Tax=Enterococcus lactis TaxID=357441 RepID=UPI00390816DE
IDAKDVIKQIEDDKRDLESILRTDVPTTTPDTPIKSLLNDISKTSLPFAVLDDNDRLLGIIIRSSVLGAISGNEVQNNG